MGTGIRETTYQPCPECRGRGLYYPTQPASGAAVCPNCFGTGIIHNRSSFLRYNEGQILMVKSPYDLIVELREELADLRQRVEALESEPADD